jgi:polysaccharide biosynthesis/export protein
MMQLPICFGKSAGRKWWWSISYGAPPKHRSGTEKMCNLIRKSVRFYARACIGCLVMLATACAGSNYSAPSAQNPAPPAMHSATDDLPAAQSSNTVEEDESSAALEALWRERTTASAGSSSSGFTVGPGDVLNISVPMISQLTNRTVRVSEDDTISLPLLGTINVAGMTEQDLRQELASRLGRYMYNPQVEVFLKTAENRVVSVLGTVKAPGRYLVTSRSDTVMTMLSRAGGATELAGSQILFFPAPTAAPSARLRETAVADASASPSLYQLTRSDTAASLSDSGSSSESAMPTDNMEGAPLVISTAGPERYLDMPVRAGDVLFVPAAGSVSVQGWVDKPGLFPVTPGMTVLGSVAAAGGADFSSSATLIRGEPGGAHREISLNLSKIQHGQEPDVPVRGGDVVVVERSVAGAIPYSLYFLIQRVGLGVPIIP